MTLANITSYDLLIWLAICWLFSRIYPVQRPEYQFGKYEWRYKPLFAILIFMPVFIMTVYGPVRSDTFLYLHGFRNTSSSFAGVWEEAIHSNRPGFIIFERSIKHLFGNNETMYRIFIALVHSIPIIYVLRKYSVNYLFSIYVFIATTLHLSWMMNGLRQFMAVTIIFAATPWIVQKKYIRSIIVILIAASFHRTALVMLPVIFIVQGKAWNWKTIAYSIAIVGLTYIFSQNASAFDTAAGIVGYSTQAVREWGDDGTHPIRVLVNAVPMIMAFVYRHRFSVEENPIINMSVNMSVITTGIYVVAMVTSGVLTGRMPIYTSLYNLILLPYIITHAFVGEKKRIMIAVTMGLFFLYFRQSI